MTYKDTLTYKIVSYYYLQENLTFPSINTVAKEFECKVSRARIIIWNLEKLNFIYKNIQKYEIFETTYNWKNKWFDVISDGKYFIIESDEFRIYILRFEAIEIMNLYGLEKLGTIEDIIFLLIELNKHFYVRKDCIFYEKNDKIWMNSFWWYAHSDKYLYKIEFTQQSNILKMH